MYNVFRYKNNEFHYIFNISKHLYLNIPNNFFLIKMKNHLLMLFPAIFIGIINSGCESPSDSKAISITTPVLTTPVDGAVDQSLTLTFKWTGGANKIEVDYNNTFNPPFYSYDGLNGATQFTMTSGQLVNNRTYYWRAGVVSGSNTFWSSNIFKFTTVP